MRSLCLFVTTAVLLGTGLFAAPQLVAAETATLDLQNGTGPAISNINLDVYLTALDLASTGGVGTINLTFSCSDPNLDFVNFTPGTLLSAGSWLDVTGRPPFPDSGWSFVNLTPANDIKTTGLLGTLVVKSDFTGIYNVAFDVTSVDVATQLGGLAGPTVKHFALTTDGGTVTVTPEPCSVMLVATGGIVLGWMRRRQRKA